MRVENWVMQFVLPWYNKRILAVLVITTRTCIFSSWAGTKVRTLTCVIAMFTVYKQLFWYLNLPTTEQKNSLFRQPINLWFSLGTLMTLRWRNGEYCYLIKKQSQLNYWGSLLFFKPFLLLFYIPYSQLF